MELDRAARAGGIGQPFSYSYSYSEIFEHEYEYEIRLRARFEHDSSMITSMITSTIITEKSTGDLRKFDRAIRYLTYGQFGFFFSLVVCVLLSPQGLLANHGFTYYGEHARTVVPYGLAFGVCGLCTLLSTWYLPDGRPFRVIKFALRLLLPLLCAVAITASNQPSLGKLHVRFGEALFGLQFGMSAWLALDIHKDWRNAAYLLLLFCSGLASLLAVYNVIPYLIEGQIIFQLAFGVVVIYTLGKLRDTPGSFTI